MASPNLRRLDRWVSLGADSEATSPGLRPARNDDGLGEESKMQAGPQSEEDELADWGTSEELGQPGEDDEARVTN